MPNIKLWKTKIRNAQRLFLFIFIFSIFLLVAFTNIPSYFHLFPKIQKAEADAHTTGGSGNWNSTTANAPWTTGVVPVAGDTVTIAAGHMVTIPAGVAAYAASIDISANGSATQNGLTFAASNSTLTLTSTVTMYAATAAPGSLFAVDAGTLSGATTLALPGAGTGTWNTIFRISTGTASFSGTITMSGTAGQSQFTFTSNGRLNVGGNFTAGGTFACSTGTINYTGGATQTYGTYTYYNIEVNKTVGTAVGAASTNVIIPIGGNLTVTTGIFNIRRLTLTVTGTTTIGNGGVVDFVLLATNAKIFVGRVTVNSGGTWQNTILTTLVVFRGGITVNSGGSFNHGNALATFNTNSQTLEGNGNMTFGGTATVATGITVTNNNTATVTVTGILTFTGGWTQGASSTLSYGSATILGNSGAGTFNANTNANLVNYTAAAPNCKVVVYSSLTFSGSGAITCATLATVNVNLTLSTASTMTWTTGAVLAVGGMFSVGSGVTFTTGANYTLSVTGATSVTGTLALSNSGAKTLIGAVTINSTGAFTVAAGSVEFRNGLTNSSGGIITIAAPATFTTNDQAIAGANSITFSSTVGISTAAKTLTNNNTGTVTVTNTLTLTGNWTQGTTTNTLVLLAAANPFSGGGAFSANGANNTVNYNYGGDQTVKAVSYYNLILSNSGIKTMTSVATIGGDLTISGGATMTDNGALAITGALNYSSSGSSTLKASTTVSTSKFNQTAGTIVDNGNTITVTGTGASVWIGSGTFTATGLVNFTGATPQIGLSNFKNLTITNSATFTDDCAVTGTFTDTTGDSILTFTGGKTYTFANIVINGTSVAHRVVMAKTGTGQWNFVVPVSAVTYVDVEYSNASNTITATTGCYDRGNNNVNWQFLVISITLEAGSGTVTYGFVATSKDTTGGVNQTQTVRNSGNVAEDFDIKGQHSANWTLDASAGDAIYSHKWCTQDCDGTPTWNAMTTTYDSSYMATNVAANGTQDFDLKVTVPTSNPGTNQQNVDVFVRATQH